MYDYKHSTFIECNEDLAKKTNLNFTQDREKNKYVSEAMVHVSGILENLYKDYWLTDGTLLGKYLFQKRLYRDSFKFRFLYSQ